MKKDRFYNILFPLWFFLFIPSTWLFLITFLGNAAIDSLVLALGCKMNHRPFVTTWKKSFLWVFAFGYLADFLGGALLFILSTVLDNPLAYAMLFNPFSSFAGFLLVALMVAVAGELIYLFNLKVSFRKLDWPLKEKRKAALVLAVLTAPYLFLFPSILLYR